MSILKVDNLTKKFGSFTAVNNVSFDLKEGEILGLLGPNGAGKTTTIQMLMGTTIPTSGEIRYFGKNFFRHQIECLQQINYNSTFNTLQGRITVWENLFVFAGLYQVKNFEKKIKNLVDYFGVKDLMSRCYRDLSSGQQTRVNIIKSLLNDPKILLMDEPTAALDPDIADKLLSFIEKLKADRKISILYTSHNMYDVTRICDRVIFLDKGKIVMQDTPSKLIKKIETARLRITFTEKKELVEKYLKENKHNYKLDGDKTVFIIAEESLLPKIIFGLSKAGVWIVDIEVKKPTLEHVFLQIARGENYVFE